MRLSDTGPLSRATQRALLPPLHCRDARGDQITPDGSIARARPRQ